MLALTEFQVTHAIFAVVYLGAVAGVVLFLASTFGGGRGPYA